VAALRTEGEAAIARNETGIDEDRPERRDRHVLAIDPAQDELPDAAVVIVLKDRIAADTTAIADSRDNLRDTAIARKRNAAIEAYRDMLRQRADISINPDVVTGART